MSKFVPKPGETIDRTHPAIGTPELIAWVESQGLDPNVVEEIHVGSRLELTVFEYLVDDQGRKYLDHLREVARRDPYVGRMRMRHRLEWLNDERTGR